MSDIIHEHEISPYNDISTITNSYHPFEFSNFNEQILDLISIKYDIFINDENSVSKVLREVKDGDTIRFPPSEYKEINISFENERKDIVFRGTGKNCILKSFNIQGDVSLTLCNMKIGNFKFDSDDGIFVFRDISMIRASLLELDGNTDISMENCIVEKDFQIIVRSGEHKITMRKCHIYAILPFILVKNGKLTINMIDTHTDKTIVVVENGECNLREINSIIPNVPCIVLKSGKCQYKEVKIEDDTSNIYKSCTVDANKYRYIRCRDETTYINVLGRKGDEFTVILADESESIRVKLAKDIKVNFVTNDDEPIFSYSEKRCKTVTLIKDEIDGWYVDTIM